MGTFSKFLLTIYINAYDHSSIPLTANVKGNYFQSVFTTDNDHMKERYVKTYVSNRSVFLFYFFQQAWASC